MKMCDNCEKMITLKLRMIMENCSEIPGYMVQLGWLMIACTAAIILVIMSK